MKELARPKVFTYQSVGFLAIIALSWIDEWIGLPTLIFKDHPYISNFHEATVEMLLVLGVWFIVTGSTRRVLEHLRNLERFLKVCAWCHRIQYKGEWISLERYFEQGFDTPTTHGICSECLHREKAAVERAKLQREAQHGEPETGGLTA
jgi:hypothetical protein